MQKVENKNKNLTIKHLALRMYIYFLLIIFFITGGLSMILLAPLYKNAFAPGASYKDLHIPRLWLHVYKVMWRSISEKSYRDMYPGKLTDPPRYSNAHSAVQIKKSWQGAEDNCDLCRESCCKQLRCPMLDKDGRRCLGYGSLYFGYLLCGRYPENQKQMDLYQCPKWEVSNKA